MFQTFEKVPGIMQTMLDNGLQEVLCNVLRAINALPPEANGDECDERHDLVRDVLQFFTVIAEKTFRYY